MIGALALLLQAAAPAAAPLPERFSILVPVVDEPCVRQHEPETVVVCADPLPEQRLPYPALVVPDRAVPSNRDMSATRALAMEGAPCGAVQRGCQVGFGPPIAPIVAGAVGLVKDALKKKPDKRGRVAIPLDDTTPLPR